MTLPEDPTDSLSLVSRLVRIQSVSGDLAGQRAVQEAVLEYVGGGVDVVRSTHGRPWTYVSTTTQPAVLFVCHTDTVPVGDVAAWSHPPFSGELIDAHQLLHGRGSVDMKGGLAAAAHTLKLAAAEGLGAALLMTGDEEIGLLGAMQAVAELEVPLAPRLVVIPEATGNRFYRGHRGGSWFTVTARGRSAHSSTPHEGINAIQLLSDHVISKLHEIPLATDDYLGVDTINLGTIQGGHAPNMVPDHAKLVLDCRTVAGDAAIREWLGRLSSEFTVTQTVDLPPLLPRAVPTVMEDFTDLGPAPYLSDGSIVQDTVGDAPVVIWGPGGEDQMHTVDESLSVASFETALANYRRVARELA